MGLVGSVEVEASVTSSPARGEAGNQVNEALGGPGGGGSAGLATVSAAARGTPARCSLPLCSGVTGPTLSVVETRVSTTLLDTVSSVSLANLPAPFGRACHSTSSGAGEPDAFAVNVAEPPAGTPSLVGDCL